MNDNDRAYFERRLKECLQRLRDTSDPSVAATYRAFVDEYAGRLAEDLPEQQRSEAA